MIRIPSFAALLVASSLVVMSAQSVSPTAAQVTTIDTMSALPFSTITITGTGFDPANTLVEFSNGARVTYRVPTLSATATTIKVAVPVYVGSFGISSGTVSVRLLTINRDGSLASGSNTITGFQIKEPPIPESFDGRLTLNFLKGARAFAVDTLRSRLAASTLGTPDAMAALDAQTASLDVLIANVEPLITTASKRFSLGYINNKDGLIDQDALGAADELIAAVFAAHAALAGPACGADEANAALSELKAKANPDIAKFTAYFAATINSANCRSTDAVNKALLAVTGINAVAVGVIGASISLPLETIAVPTLSLVYSTAAILTGEFAAGVEVGQTSSTAVEATQSAFEGMKGPGEALIARPVGQALTIPANVVDVAEKAISVHSVYVVTNAFSSTLASAPPFRGGAAKTGTQVPVTVAISGSGKGMVASLPSGIGCTGTGCSSTFASGEIVVQATPLTGSRFAGWGGACSGTGPCVLTLDASKALTLRFDPAP